MSSPWTVAAWLQELLSAVDAGHRLHQDEITRLIEVSAISPEADFLRLAANNLTRSRTGEQAIISSQIGLDARPCSGGCAFCGFSAEHHGRDFTPWRLSADDVQREVKSLVDAGVNYVGLMTTADYPVDEYLRMCLAARSAMPNSMVLAANIGDFDRSLARELRRVGVGRVYHVLRLGEGQVTRLDPAKRLETMEAAAAEGLELTFCLEPVGPEHSAAELAERIEVSRQVRPNIMAVMRRIPLPGSPFSNQFPVSEVRMAQLLAIARLAHAHERAMVFYIHEPSLLGLMAGANMICAERATNPREGNATLDTWRGLSVAQCKRMVNEAGFVPRQEPNYPGTWFPGFSPV